MTKINFLHNETHINSMKLSKHSFRKALQGNTSFAVTASTFLIGILICEYSVAQTAQTTVTPSTNAGAAAVLTINASNPTAPAVTDGVLIPRVATLVTPGAAQNGMMVMLTAATTIGTRMYTPGLYAWNTVGGWAQAGISGSNIALGSNSNVGNAFNAIAIGSNASAVSNSPFFDNVAVGVSTVSSGDQTVAIGPQATSSGRHTVALGFLSSGQAETSVMLGAYAGTNSRSVDTLNIGVGH